MQKNRKIMMVDLKQLVRTAAKQLDFADDATGDVYEILKKITGFSRTDVLLNPVREVSEEQLEMFHEFTEKRKTGYPLQYILGEWDFCSNSFFVCEGVLIPRTETEEIVYKACQFLKNKKEKTVFDLCCGTGCIGLSVAVNNPDCKVYLFDIEDKAVALTQKNINKLGLKNAEVFKCDIFDCCLSDIPKPDVILSNPPYVTNDEYKTLQTEIFYEPKNAIVCDGDALDFYRCIAEKWLPNMNADGFFMLESGEEQPEQIVEILKNSKFFDATFYDIQCCDDFFGVCRFVKGEYHDF